MKRNLPIILTLPLAFFLGSFSLFAQGTVRGVITDANGEPLIGANVLVIGTSIGAATDLDGNYALQNVPAGEQALRFSYTGFITQEKTVTVARNATVTLNVVLNENTEVLDEVIVIGYGTKRKSEVTGSISRIEPEEITSVSTPSFETALQGQAAGVQVVQGSGLAGSASIVRIRGNSSLSSGGDPLYVVDGIPITQDYFLGENRGNQNLNPLATINPNDIESIDILKDASAAAIYGSRGANGVIIITTKRGKKGKPQFSLSTKLGASRPTNTVDFVNGPELLQLYQEAHENDGGVGRVTLPSALANNKYAANNYTFDEVQQINTDWFDEVIQTGMKQEYNLSMRQGSDLLSTYVGASYSNNETYHVGNRYERLSGRVNLDIKPLSFLDINISTSLSRGLNNRVDPLADGLGLAQSVALPIFPIYNKDGEYFNVDQNPVARRDHRGHRTIELRSINNVAINIRPVKNLTLSITGNYDYMNLDDYIVTKSDYFRMRNLESPNSISGVYADGLTSRSEQWETIVDNWSTYGTAQYDFDDLLGDNHSLSILGGVEYQQKESNGEFWEYSGLDDFVYQESTSDGTVQNNTRYTIDQEKFFSLFSRLNYAFKDRYLLQVTFRRDGSSRFGDQKRFGNFPSVGLGYIVSREPFWNSTAINFFKLKASWGITGNADISWQEQFPVFSFIREGEVNSGLTYQGERARWINKLPNPDLQWEVVTTYDAGFEMGFLDDRVTFDFTYYYQETTDAILDAAVQATSGFEQLTLATNVAKIKNEGIEVSINSRNLVARNKRGLNWTTTLNLGHNQNKVLEVGTATPDALAGGFGDTRAIPGEPMNTNFIIRWAGLDPATGYPIYLTAEGEEIDEYRESLDRVVAGNGMPSVTGGLNNAFEWNNFDLSAMFVFSIGGEIYDDAAKRQRGTISIDNEGSWIVRRDILGNYWQQPGDNATYPRLTLDHTNYGLNGIWNNNTTFWLEPASYLRLRTLTLGYTLPFDLNLIESARVFFQGTNLWTLTDFSGWDPEIARERGNAQERNIGGTNVTYLTPPQEKVFLFGLDLQF